MTELCREEMPWPRLTLGVLLFAVLLTPGHLSTPDAHLRLAQARNLVSHGSLSVPQGIGNPAHGNLAPGREGKMQSVYNPGHALLLAPIYWGASLLPSRGDVHPHYTAAFAVSMLGIVAHLVIALLLIAVLLKLGRSYHTSLVVGALFAFGTVSLPLAADGYDHVFEALAIIVSLYLLVEDEVSSKERRPLLAGLALGAGILFRYSVLLALPGLIWIANSRQSRLRFLFGVAPAILLALCYNLYRFGTFFDTGYPEAWQLAHGNEINQTGFQFSDIAPNLIGLLASPGKGLLWYSPVLVLAIPAWASFRRAQPRLADGVTLITIMYLGFYAANFAWHGSVWSWGPRYVVPVVPLIILSIAFLSKRKLWRSILVTTGIVSIVIQATAMTADHRRHLLKEYTQNPYGFEQRLLYSFSSSPVIGQFKSAVHVVRSTFGGEDYRAFIAPGPWRSEARPASNELMLARSIDLNVVDVWWIRLAFFWRSGWAIFFGIIVGGLGSVYAVRFTRSVWHTTS